MIKAIIFDLQGTLVENGVFPSPVKQVRNILRVDMPFTDFVMRFEKTLMTTQHQSLKDAFTKLFEEFHLVPKEYLMERLVGMWNKNKLLSKPYPDTLKVLEDLHGKYKLVLIANIDIFSKDILDTHSLRSYFDEVILSCDTGYLKSDKEFYNTVIDKFDLKPEEIVLVGDSMDSDMHTADELGIRGVLIDRYNRREFPQRIVHLDELYKYLENSGE